MQAPLLHRAIPMVPLAVMDVEGLIAFIQVAILRARLTTLIALLKHARLLKQKTKQEDNKWLTSLKSELIPLIRLYSASIRFNLVKPIAD